MNAYERPEILELGDAGALTMGVTNQTVADGCDCTKCGGGEEDPIEN
jgi:hypothetical protein